MHSGIRKTFSRKIAGNETAVFLRDETSSGTRGT